MAKPPVKPKSASSSPDGDQKPSEIVPRKSIEILNDRLGIDLSADNPDQILAVLSSIKRSASMSPYTSADMLQEYKDRGFPELVGKVIDTIDTENAHRQQLEKFAVEQEQKRLNGSQRGAQFIAVLGVVGSLIAGYFHVSVILCSIVAAASIGGPPAASIVLKVLHRRESSE